MSAAPDTGRGPVLVIGASGQLARALAEAGGDDVVTAGRARFDMLAGDADALFGEIAPRAVINAAAFTDVNGAEDNRDAAMALNRDAVARLGTAARAARPALLPYLQRLCLRRPRRRSVDRKRRDPAAERLR